ncbi:MAG: hypothetical protein ACE14M_02450 [Terriglobales bacterium]
MPILMIGVLALTIFLIMGALLISASVMEKRRARQVASAVETPVSTNPVPPPEEKPKARAAHA